MYIYLDQPVGRLANGERFLLWGMRGWSHAMEKGMCAPMALSRGFTAVNALAGLPDFHLAMALLNRDALVQLRLAPMEYARIMEDAVMAKFVAAGLDMSELARESLKEGK